MTQQEALKELENLTLDYGKRTEEEIERLDEAVDMAIAALRANAVDRQTCDDAVSRQQAIDAVEKESQVDGAYGYMDTKSIIDLLCELPAVQPERKWTPCSNPPKHHKDVIVRGIEAIGNVTVHKVMQWDVDTWRPTDYAPSVMWKEWSEI